MRGFRRTYCAALLLVGLAIQDAEPQAPRAAYPVPPRALPEGEEIALALSAAPDEVSSKADVWVLRGVEFARARTGTNGCACIVSRDLHEGSLYPICFDQEGARTLLFREMMETSLRAKGLSEAEVRKSVQDASARGELSVPSKPSLAYMMSPKQILFSSQDSSGRRVGSWQPHIMLSGVNVSKKQIGLPERSRYLYIQAGGEPSSLHDLVILLPVWSDNTPAPISAR
jgi:hypothetical protein